MSKNSANTLLQFDALNKWLSDVYGGEIVFDTLLIDEGFHEAEIEQIKQEHLKEFLQAFIDLLASYTDLSIEGRNILMVEHYGLTDGKPLGYYVVAPKYGVCGERIRQLVNQCLNLYRDPKRQATFRNDFAAIARRLLGKEISSKG